MGRYVTDGKTQIGYEFINGKKPCIVVRRGNRVDIIGTFNNNNDAVFFVDMLSEFINSKEMWRID